MFGLLKRLFRVAEAKSHHAIDKIEDPIRMTEQGIRDLKKDLQSSLESLAAAKAVLIKLRNDVSSKQALASSYEEKAILLLKKAESGSLSQSEADRLASSALAKKDQTTRELTPLSKSLTKQETQAEKLEGRVKELRGNIEKWEDELETLKARSTVAQASKKLNKQLAQVDSSSTLALLEKMRSKVDEDEALAESYGDMSLMTSTNEDSEIDAALSRSGAEGIESGPSDSLAALKKRLQSREAPSQLPPH